MPVKLYTVRTSSFCLGTPKTTTPHCVTTPDALVNEVCPWHQSAARPATDSTSSVIRAGGWQSWTVLFTRSHWRVPATRVVSILPAAVGVNPGRACITCGGQWVCSDSGATSNNLTTPSADTSTDCVHPHYWTWTWLRLGCLTSGTRQFFKHTVSTPGHVTTMRHAVADDIMNVLLSIFTVASTTHCHLLGLACVAWWQILLHMFP